MKRFLIVSIVLLVFPLSLMASESLPWDTDPSTVWPASSGQARMELRGDYLIDFGVEVVQAGQLQAERLTAPASVGDGRLWIYAPYGNFEAFSGGELAIGSNLRLERGNRVADFSDIRLIPTEQDRTAQLQVHDGGGNHLATITHIHALAHPERSELTLHNADLKGSAWLARHLGVPDLEGMPLGQMWLDLAIDVPADANLSRTTPDRGGLSCTGRPFWPQDDPSHIVDVELIDIGTIAYQGRETSTDRIKVAPSATLKNVGFGDAAWIPKFTTESFYTFVPRDQHPFLVWNMYRISDGRIEQLGASGVKHAFLTLNFNCTINCPGGNGHILWPGCEDVYSTGNNDDNFNQGPRDEILASEGLFWSTGSFFDPGSTGSQTNNSTTYQNRLMIKEAELSTAGADYFLDSWYVVQYDVDIWNSMGYHSISPSPSGSGWSFGPLGPFTNGPPINNWVAENTVDPMEGHEIVVLDGPTPAADYPDNMPSGHLRVLVKVTDLGGGEYRYNYAVMNFDFDHGIGEFAIPLSPGATVSETYMGGPADELDSPWPASVSANEVRFSAPAGEKLPWFTLYNFEIVVDQAPAADGGVTLVPFVDAGARDAHLPAAVLVDTLAPGSTSTVLFEDRFEAE